MDTAPLEDAYRALLDAAATVADAGGADLVPPSGEWNADQILAHVSIISAVTSAAVAAVASGAHTTYDNRLSQDPWTIDRTIELAGGAEGLRDRVRLQGEALGALAGPVLSDAELGTPVPARLISNNVLMLDAPVPLGDLIAGLAGTELPGHTGQLLALLPDRP